jgi:hypothetical protein
MSIRNVIRIIRTGTGLIPVLLLLACGDSSSTSDENSVMSGSDSGTSGTDTTVQSGGSGGSEDSEAGRPTSFEIGDSGFGFGDFSVECGEPAPTEPVVCGGVTCEDPASAGGFGMTSCVYACCASSGGTEVCGAKDTTVGNEVACQPPPEPDPRCPDYEYAPETTQAAGGDSGAAPGMTTTLPGCCTPTNQCGVISSMRPLCITQSLIIDLPETPRACDANE